MLAIRRCARRRWALASLTTFALCGLAACGGADEEGGGDEELTRDAYVERANDICGELGRELSALADETFGGRESAPPARIDRRYAERTDELLRTAGNRLRALPRPPGDEEQLESVWAAFEEARREIAASPPRRPDSGEVGASERFGELARAYGLDECAGEPGL